MGRFRRSRATIAVLALTLLIAACGGGDDTAEDTGIDEPVDTADESTDAAAGDEATDPADDADEPADDPDEADEAGDRDQVSIAVANFPPSAEPWTGVGSPGQYVWSAVFDALTVIGEDGTPQPALATEWENVDDTTWEFTLREGVTFHDGSPVTVEDVVGTFELLLSEEGAAAYGSHVGNYGFIDTVTASDDTTVQITTSAPSPLVPAAISIVYIAPMAYFEEVGAETFATEPIGTGPYMSTSWGSDRIQLERYEDSWRETTIPQLEYVNLNDPASRTQALQSGQVDVIIAGSADALGQLESEGFTSYVANSGRLMSLAMITNEGGPLAEREVRQAMNHAVDRTAIAEALVGGLTEASAWPPPGVNGHDPDREPYPFDADLARELLESAGYGDGFDISAEVTLGAFPADREIYEATASYLSEVGIDLELTEIDFAQDWLPKYTGAGGADWAGEAFGSTWVSPPLLDAVRPLTQYRCDWSNPWFCNEELDTMLADVNSELDPDARDAQLGELLDVVYEEAPALWLIELVELWATDADLEGWEVHSFNPTFEQLR